MGRRSFAVSLALALLPANGMAQTAPANSKEIHQLYLDDQADRGVSLEGTQKKKATPDDVAANDSARRKRTHRLLEQGALRTGADFHDAAFIFQHATSQKTTCWPMCWQWQRLSRNYFPIPRASLDLL